MSFGKPWAKGVSGNPSGQPKGIVRELREKHSGDLPKIMAAMVAIALDPTAKERDRVKASEFVFDRLLGKPTQTIDANITTDQGSPIDWSAVPVERRREMLSMLSELGALEAEPDPGSGDPH